MALLDTLTDEQRAAVLSREQDAILTAAAGAGKTRVLVARIVHLIEEDVEPEDITVFAFTRSACEEIRTRVADHVGPTKARQVRIQTFHAYARAIVMPDGFRVATELECQTVRDGLLKPKIGASRNPMYVPGIGGLHAFDLALVEHEANLRVQGSAVSLARQRLYDQRLIPTWDLIPLIFGGGYAIPQARHVLVDEAQDITFAEGLLISRIEAPEPWGLHHFAVHDPRQAIMGFRGAIGTQALSWMPDPQRLELTRCFRFGPEIAEVANRIAAMGGYGPIEGVGSAGEVQRFTDRPIEGGNLFLARTNFGAESWSGMYGGAHVRRDPLNPLEADADKFADVWASGRDVVSTVHSAKGREADCVVILDHDDPRSPFPRKKDPEDLRVLYVAVTRARRNLMIGQLSSIGEESINAPPPDSLNSLDSLTGGGVAFKEPPNG